MFNSRLDMPEERINQLSWKRDCKITQYAHKERDKKFKKKQEIEVKKHKVKG